MKKNSFGSYREDRADDSEDVVDLETGEIAKPVKKEKSRSREVFELFGKYPRNWLVNKSQRTAADNLLAERGMEQIKAALAFARDHEDDKFCPFVMSPWDLDSKWKKLFQYKNKL